ncbi:hypothetical protein L1987_12396 [Smallanthus sonchifolius]|uniref:Uncharacterized protein n=1 Tax=Smallanthus sonchifolius TaxID=185202 RepID=A0ACB9JEH1_9ASTR|nr:hypothetical protein L1987_12396 [Smallanthus sonchifolius]
MCLGTTVENLYRPSYLTTHHLQRNRVMGRKDSRNKTRVLFVMLKRKMAMKNLKLYMQNQCMIEENAKLRRKALLLHQENQILFSQLQNVKNSQ